jgi:hypothetical protein
MSEDRSAPWSAGVLLALASASVLVATGVTLGVLLPLGDGVHFSNGTITAHATDLVEGTFYRPTLGLDGYGGSRYMPLHFVLHASLIPVFGDPIPAGYAVTAAATLALLLGFHRLLRSLGVPSGRAIAFTCLALASFSSQMALMAIRADLLPAALNVWGLVFCVGAVLLPARRDRGSSLRPGDRLRLRVEPAPLARRSLRPARRGAPRGAPLLADRVGEARGGGASGPSRRGGPPGDPESGDRYPRAGPRAAEIAWILIGSARRWGNG